MKAAVRQYMAKEQFFQEAVLAEVAEEAGTGFPYWMTDTKLGKFTKVSKGMYRLPSLNGGEGALLPIQ